MSSNDIIIGLIGRRSAGKSTVAAFLQKEYGFAELAFATALKSVCQQLFCLSDAQLSDRILKETVDDRWGKSPRQLFQWFGTDVMRRQFMDGFWVERLRYDLETATGPVVVSDIRFANELAMIRSLMRPVIIIRIDRDTTLDALDQHASEAEQLGLDADFTIQNRGTIPDLHRGIAERLMSDMRFHRWVQVPRESLESLESRGQTGMPEVRECSRTVTSVPDPNVHGDLSSILLHA
jgi:hypothetical protein